MTRRASADGRGRGRRREAERRWRARSSRRRSSGARRSLPCASRCGHRSRATPQAGRQRERVECARRGGVWTVEVIDDDPDGSTGGMVARPGFQARVAAHPARARPPRWSCPQCPVARPRPVGTVRHARSDTAARAPPAAPRPRRAPRCSMIRRVAAVRAGERWAAASTRRYDRGCGHRFGPADPGRLAAAAEPSPPSFGCLRPSCSCHRVVPCRRAPSATRMPGAGFPAAIRAVPASDRDRSPGGRFHTLEPTRAAGDVRRGDRPAVCCPGPTPRAKSARPSHRGPPPRTGASAEPVHRGRPRQARRSPSQNRPS